MNQETATQFSEIYSKLAKRHVSINNKLSIKFYQPKEPICLDPFKSSFIFQSSFIKSIQIDEC